MVNVLVLNWHSSDATELCLKALLTSESIEFRIILINNFSTEEDYIRIKNIYECFKLGHEVYLIDNAVNLGYAGGNNSGYRFLNQNKLNGDILIINPDIIVSKNTIKEMVNALANNVGIVSVRTKNSKGEIILDAIRLNGFIQKYIITKLDTIETDYSQGSCLLIKREVVENIGLFDERFFLYWEEVDLSIRTKKIGKKLISTTKTFVIRNSNCISRSPKAFYYSIRNARLIKQKHKDYFSTYSYFLYLIFMFMISLKFISKPILFSSVISNYLNGLVDSFRNKFYKTI